MNLKVAKILLWSLLLVSCAKDPCTGVSKPANPLLGVNLSGAEFSSDILPGKLHTNYMYPQDADLAYFSSRGFTIIRLPFRWERIQPELGKPLDRDELSLIINFLESASKYRLKVILDVHNFGSYKEKKIGTGEVPIESFVDLWGLLAQSFKNNPVVWGYGLMNEPVGLKDGVWPEAAQKAIYEIRKYDRNTQILVGGESWSSSERWKEANPLFPLKDPENNLRYEAHAYFDKDASGRYKNDYEGEEASLERVDKRLGPFIHWLKLHNAKGFIGEYGVPSDPKWQLLLKYAIWLMQKNNLPSTYWSAGRWWGGYPLSIQPFDGCLEKPQMESLVENWVIGRSLREF